MQNEKVLERQFGIIGNHYFGVRPEIRSLLYPLATSATSLNLFSSCGNSTAAVLVRKKDQAGRCSVSRYYYNR